MDDSVGMFVLGQWSGQNIQLIQILFVIAFLALSGLGWVIRKAQEQAEKKRVQTERQRRLDEMLRTGRDPSAEQATAMAQASSADRARMEEIARRRQMQMEQARREHAQRRQDGQRGGRRDQEIPPLVIMGPSGPITVPRGGTPGGRTGTPTPRPTVARPAPTRPQARPVGRPQPKPQRKPDRPQQQPQQQRPITPVPVLPEPQQRPASPMSATPIVPAARGGPRGMVVLPPIGSAGSVESSGAGASRSRQAEYRRLIAMMEAMRPPLVIREQEEPGPVYRAF